MPSQLITVNNVHFVYFIYKVQNVPGWEFMFLSELNFCFMDLDLKVSFWFSLMASYVYVQMYPLISLQQELTEFRKT